MGLLWKTRALLTTGLTALGVTLTTPEGWAESLYWTNGGSTGRWGDAANWDPHSVPFRDNVVFNSVQAPGSQSIDVGLLGVVNDATFAVSAGSSFTLRNGVVTLLGDLTHSGAGAVQIDSTLAMAGNTTLRIDATAPLTTTGDIIGGVHLHKAGSGTVIIAGHAYYAGTIHVEGGTLLLGADQRISDSTKLALEGGTFATGGHSETLGHLTLQENSVIDFGQGNSVLQFAMANGWGGQNMLTIDNWSGSLAGGGTDQLIFGSIQSHEVDRIFFRNPAGFAPGYYGAMVLASGEIIPIPEPAGLMLVGLLGGTLLWRERRCVPQFARWLLASLPPSHYSSKA